MKNDPFQYKKSIENITFKTTQYILEEKFDYDNTLFLFIILY